MTLHRAFAILVFTVLLASPIRAASAEPAPDATCDARIEGIDLRGDTRYSPFQGEPAEWPLEIRVGEPGGCRLSLTFRSPEGGRLRGPGARLDYRLRDDDGRSLSIDGGTRWALPGVATSAAPARAVVSLAPGQGVAPGHYSDRLLVQLLDGEQVVDQRDFDLRVQVRSQASVSLAGHAAAGFSRTFGAGLDFGELANGKEREAFLSVLSNSAYALRFSSAHQGHLRHATAPPPNTIPYVAMLDSTVLDLSGVAIVDGHNPQRFLALPPYRLNVRIGDVTGRPAGQYRDVITVEVVILE